MMLTYNNNAAAVLLATVPFIKGALAGIVPSVAVAIVLLAQVV